MDTQNTIRNNIVMEVAGAVQNLETLKAAIQEVKAAAGKSSQPFNDAPMRNFAASYSRTISDMTRQAEGLYQAFQRTGNVKEFTAYQSLIPQIQQLTREQKAFNESLGRTGSLAQNVGQSFSKHLGWIATGIGVGSVISGVTAAIQDISKLDTEFNQLKTVLPELEGNQATYNQAVKDSFALAERYGEKIERVTESLRLMGRGYHELGQAEKLSEIALKLGVADNFDPQTATKSIEAVVGAYGKQAEAVTFATHVMDAMTKVSHNHQVSANDLAESLLRSSAAAKTVGVSFDELNAMTAVVARNTGLSGQTIGDGLKSILNSIHSKKAIEDLESMGVAVYKVGNDGAKEFRKISDVLMDVMAKTQGTSENFEKLFRDLSGGKFQVTKLASLLGDPAEYLRALGNSINSSGFTDKQLAIQMDTIQRKASTLKASFEELLTTGGSESGFKNALKGILDTLNQVIKGLNSVNPVAWSAAGIITEFAVAFVALRTAINFATSSYTFLRGAIVSTTAAQEALNVAVTANPWGAIAKLIVLAGTALATYAFYAGEAATAQEKAAASTENAITAKASEIEMTKQQTEYLGTLGNAYVGLKGALVEAAGNEEKSAKIKETMGVVSQQLTQIVGQEAADRILASNNIMDAIAQEQQVHNEKTAQMQQELNDLRGEQVRLATDAVNASNERITAIVNEANNTAAAADAIESALGRIDSAFYRYYKGKAQYFRDTADMIAKVQQDAQSGFGGGLDGAMAQVGWADWQGNTGLTLDQSGIDYADAKAAEADQEAQGIADRAIAAENEKKRQALAPIYSGGTYRSSPGSTGEVAEAPGKAKNGRSKGTGSPYAPDREDAIAKLWANHEVHSLLAESKVAAEKYQEALSKLQVQQDLFGQSSETDSARLALMAARVSQLTTETDALTKTRDDFAKKANDLIAGHAEATAALKERKLSWSSLGKEEKRDFIHAYLGDVADQRLAVSYLDNVDKLTAKIAENNKAGTELSGGILLAKKNNATAAYGRTMKTLSQDEELDTLQLGPNASEEQKRVVKLRSAILELQEAVQRLYEIENSDHSPEELRQQEVEVEKLKVKVLELKDVWKSFGEEASAALDKILLQGEDIGKVFSNSWKQLASAALKSLVTGKRVEGGGLFGSLLGALSANKSVVPDMQGGSGVQYSKSTDWLHEAANLAASKDIQKLVNGAGSGAAASTQTGGAQQQQQQGTNWGSVIGSLASLFHAKGGVVNSPAIAGEDGEEVIVPVEKNTGNSQNLLSYAAKKLGTSTAVTPYLKNPETAQKVIADTASNRAHLDKLDTQISLMAQQNTMLLHMINSGMGGNTTNILAPQQQSPTMSDFSDMLSKSQALRYTK